MISPSQHSVSLGVIVSCVLLSIASFASAAPCAMVLRRRPYVGTIAERTVQARTVPRYPRASGDRVVTPQLRARTTQDVVPVRATKSGSARSGPSLSTGWQTMYSSNAPEQYLLCNTSIASLSTQALHITPTHQSDGNYSFIN